MFAGYLGIYYGGSVIYVCVLTCIKLVKKVILKTLPNNIALQQL